MQPFNDVVDAQILSNMEQWGTPGASIAIFKSGKILKCAGFGVANVELSVSATPSTVYKLGSLSKQFIAYGLMLLVEDGKVDLHTSVTYWLPNAPKTWDAISLHHLLTHTSGLSLDVPDFDPYRPCDLKKSIDNIQRVPLAFNPGDQWSYSNAGYYVLAYIIQCVSGLSFDAFLMERIFYPAEMHSTYLTSVNRIIKNRSCSYIHQGESLYNAGDLLSMRPSGAFASSVEDLLKWENVLSNGSLLPLMTRELMERPVSLNDGTTYPYGYGWHLDSRNGHRIVRHGGGLWCFRCEYLRIPTLGFAVIILANAKESDVTGLALALADIYLEESGQFNPPEKNILNPWLVNTVEPVVQ